MGRPPAAAVVSHLGYRTAAAVDGMIIAEMEQPKTALNLLCKSVKKKVRKFYGNAPASGPVSDASDRDRQPGDQALIFCMSASDTSKLA
jgi:hypothetical protein